MSEQEQQETVVDPKAIRAAVLEVTPEWSLIDDIQGEVNTVREKSGASPFFTPIQVVRAICDELVEDQRLEVQLVESVAGAFVVVEENGRPRYRRRPDDRAESRRRRAAILRHLLPQAGEPEAVNDAAGLVARLASESIPATERLITEDLHDLMRSGAAVPESVGGRTVYALRERALAELLATGAEALAVKSLPAVTLEEVTAETPTPDGVAFQQRLQEELSLARAARAKSDADKEKLSAFLTEKGIVVDDVLGRKPAPARKVFTWTQSRTVDMAEKGLIFEEVRKLEAKVADVLLRLDGAKSRAKAEREDLEAEIEALKNAADCNQRILSVQAYRETDWDARVDIIRSVDDDRELAREDILRGTQKPIPGTGPGPMPPAPASADEAPLVPSGDPAETPALADVRGAVLDVLRAASGPATKEEIDAAIGGAFVCPEGFEALTKMELARAVKDGAVKHVKEGKTSRWSLPVTAEPKAAASRDLDDEDEDDDEDLDDADEPEPVVAAPAKKGKKKHGRRTGEARA